MIDIKNEPVKVTFLPQNCASDDRAGALEDTIGILGRLVGLVAK